MWIKLVNPNNPAEWSFVDPTHVAGFLKGHPNWKRVPRGCERVRPRAQGVPLKAKQPAARPAAKPQPPRLVARETRRADPIPRTAMQAVQLGYNIHQIREWQRMGLLPL
ncbi:MAG: hypothetical protein JOY71_23150 [Acetobacteraceae bacterium]|nr:hypothetical protein [Acetobacteraceae bacterium]MBV8524980.1 hypothetical protein [Acetobacteraceae bacterium]